MLQESQQPENIEEEEQYDASEGPQNAKPSSPDLDEGVKFLSAVGYVSFLCMLPLILKKDDPYAQYHGKQALVMAIFWFAVRLVFFFLTWVTLIELAVIAWCAYSAYKGKKFTLPFIGKYAKKIKF